MEVQNNTLAKLLDQAKQLYTLPGVALRVLELTNNPQVDATELKACIERDPALTIKVLRVVNSSLFGMSRRVSDLNQSLTLLGTKPLKLLVLGFSLPDQLFTDLAGDVLSRYWRHTLTRAVAARELSERLWKLPGDEIFVAGLLKDLGRLVLIQGLGRPYVEFLRRADFSRGQIRSLERHVLGFDHTQLTAGLLEQWGLPPALVEAVRSPDTRDELDALPRQSRAMAQILYVAGRLAELLADQRTEALSDILQAVRKDHHLSDRHLAGLAAGLDETVTQLADVLSLELPGGLAYSEVLARAYVQLSEAAAEAAGELSAPTARVEQLIPAEVTQELSQAAASFSPLLTEARPRSPAVTHGASRAASSGGRAGKDHAAGSRAAVLPDSEIEPGLAGRLRAAATACRQVRRELSLLMLEIDWYDELLLTRGIVGLGEIAESLETECRAADPAGPGPQQLTDSRWALILPGSDRTEASDTAHDLLRRMRELAAGVTPFSVSIGLATAAVPAKNFNPIDLIHSAERCLSTAQLSGGNCVKTIEIY
ncbi:MAG TPA: HDOD domain-containing protein [Pirellulales bacterium]|nr:HDOD domain-containing protein [Pirellulales bacterium]